MRIDIMSILWDEIGVASRRVGGWIQGCFRLHELIVRESAVTQAKRIVVDPRDKVDGASVGSSGCQDGTDGKLLADGVSIFAIDLVLENW